MWIDDGVPNTVAVSSIWPWLGPALRHRLAAASWTELTAVERDIEASDVGDTATSLEAHRRAGSHADSEFGGAGEADFAWRTPPDEVRLELARDDDQRPLGEALVDLLRAVPLRWRLDVVQGVHTLLWDLQDRRPKRERGTVWDGYGRRHRGRRAEPR